MALTPKQKRFCDEYLIDLNATQAAIRAGYSERTAKQMGTENLSKPAIKAYIEERMAEKEAELVASQDEVLQYLTSVMRGETRAHVLGIGTDGASAVFEKPPDEKERLKAAELLGKRYALFVDRQQMDGDITISVEVEEDG